MVKGVLEWRFLGQQALICVAMNFVSQWKVTTDESEIQEVNPPKTVAPPPTASTADWRKTYKMRNGSLYQYN